MKFLIRRRVRSDKSSEQNEFLELQVQTQRLTIGRAPDQHLQIAESSVELQHAVISVNRDGISIKALKSSGFIINGEHHMTANLSLGDTIKIGSVIITVEQLLIDHPVVISIDYIAGSNKESLCSLHYTELSQISLSKHCCSWLLVISLVSLFLLIPVSGIIYPPLQKLLRNSWLIPDDNLWLTGPLHTAHQVIGKDCSTCHSVPFKMVQNQQCLACHTDIQHHVDISKEDIENFEQNRCASCHREHNEPSILVQRDQRFCTDCHEQLNKLKTDTKLANITDFGDNHPDFRLTLLKAYYGEDKTHWESERMERNQLKTIEEQSFLQFSHKQHLNPEGIRTSDGDQVLACQNCHRPNASGRQMLPINMEKHCSECHKLIFDENNLVKQVPHGDLNVLYESLKEHFSLQFLQPGTSVFSNNYNDQHRIPGGENRILSLKEKQRAFNWMDKQSLSIAEDLIENQLCIDCHKISKDPYITGIDQWQLEPVVLSKQWMPLAYFDHASHDVEECISCHKNAEKSEKSSDILMPKIKICRECHAGVNEKVKLKSGCVMCHKFHLPNRGLFEQEQRQVFKEKFLLEVESFHPLKKNKNRQ